MRVSSRREGVGVATIHDSPGACNGRNWNRTALEVRRLPGCASCTDLAQLLDDNLRATAKDFDAPRDAEPLAPILHLWLIKFWAVTAPNHHCEEGVRIGFVQVEKEIG